jgi:hypothetical protein
VGNKAVMVIAPFMGGETTPAGRSYERRPRLAARRIKTQGGAHRNGNLQSLVLRCSHTHSLLASNCPTAIIFNVGPRNIMQNR